MNDDLKDLGLTKYETTDGWTVTVEQMGRWVWFVKVSRPTYKVGMFETSVTPPPDSPEQPQGLPATYGEQRAYLTRRSAHRAARRVLRAARRTEAMIQLRRSMRI